MNIIIDSQHVGTWLIGVELAILANFEVFGLPGSREPEDDGRLFLYEGYPIQDVKRAWAAAIRRAGITRLRLHDLRHTFNTRRLEAGVISDTRKGTHGPQWSSTALTKFVTSS